jgi:uncharacterized membrane protein YcaP (DUF421 family)
LYHYKPDLKNTIFGWCSCLKRLTGNLSLRIPLQTRPAIIKKVQRSSSKCVGLFFISLIKNLKNKFHIANTHTDINFSFIDGEPTIIIKDGVINNSVLKKEQITQQELYEALRQEGVAEIKDVKQATLETNGHLSVVKQ